LSAINYINSLIIDDKFTVFVLTASEDYDKLFKMYNENQKQVWQKKSILPTVVGHVTNDQ